MDKKQTIQRYQTNIQNEVNSAAVYRAMADSEKSPALSEVFRKLAAVEDRHIHFWENELRKLGAEVLPHRVTTGGRAMRWIARRFGAQTVLPIVAAAECEDQGVYDHQPESKATALPGDERSHTRVLQAMLTTSPGSLDGNMLGRLEGRHRAIGGNALRAAVLGANDGLLSNLSLLMGVSGAAMSNHGIVITGFAGLLAGAFSMGIGEWISVQSSRELHLRELQVEAEELATMPEEEREEISLIYQAKGFSKDEAERLAGNLMKDKKKALDTLAREELGIDPDELGGSAWEAALTSFALFSVGALIPIIPYFITSGRPALAGSVALSAVGLFVMGAGTAFITGRSMMKAGLRQVAMALVASGITFAIGKLLGVTLAG